MPSEEKLKADATWDIVDVVAKRMGLRREIVIRLINMIEKQECTVPFIARYRKDQTSGMNPDSLRNFVHLLQELRLVQKKSETMIKNVQKQGMLDIKTEISFIAAQTLDELDLAFSPFKGVKASLANRARSLGLGEAADSVLSNPSKTDLRKWVQKRAEGKSTLSDVETGVKHILADLFYRDISTMERVREIFQSHGMTLQSKLSTKKTAETKQSKSGVKPSSDVSKYQLYHDFSCKLTQIKSYQILAINRGETQKHLTVKIVISKEMENAFLSWSRKKWTSRMLSSDILNVAKNAVEDSYTRLLKPFVLRRARSDLTKKAQQEAIEVFSRNLKKLLLTPPLHGKVVLGIDPGFKNGCKCAVISSTGNEVLSTDVFHLGHSNVNAKLKQLHKVTKFEVIAIGNGTACRETECLISNFITRNSSLDLVYCIVNESGASIYSVTSEAKIDLPDLDPNLRSAVSIARRLQDPLIELVKIEPKHIGVGMYQHDIPDSHLKTALDSVIEDCVTFVGVDLNSANESLLSRIAGLKKSQAKNIIQARSVLGGFVNRQQLLEVKGIGEKTFQQCAGFIRINQGNLYKSVKEQDGTHETVRENAVSGRKRKIKSTASNSKKKKFDWKPNPLDQTWIHPESYAIAERLVEKLNLSVENLGKKCFIDRMKGAIYDSSLTKLAQELSVDVGTVQLINEGLSQESGFRDIRNEMRRPLFRRGVTSLQELSRTSGRKVSGRITNVTDFGAFVDVGVGHDGLIHCSDAGGRWEEMKQCLGPNDTVEVLVKNVDVERKRISLKLIQADMSRTTFR